MIFCFCFLRQFANPRDKKGLPNVAHPRMTRDPKNESDENNKDKYILF